MLEIHICQNRLHQLGDVFPMFAQQWHMNVEHVQTIVKIVAKFTVSDRFFGHFVRGGKHSNVDRGLDLASQTPKRTVLEDAQQLGLSSDRHLADFIKQQGSAFSQLEASDPALQRSRKSAFFVTKDFAFNQRLRDRGAVDRYERLATTRAELVNRAGDKPFAGTTRPSDQHRSSTWCNHLDETEDLLHLFGGSHQAA